MPHTQYRLIGNFTKNALLPAWAMWLGMLLVIMSWGMQLVPMAAPLWLDHAKPGHGVCVKLTSVVNAMQSATQETDHRVPSHHGMHAHHSPTPSDKSQVLNAVDLAQPSTPPVHQHQISRLSDTGNDTHYLLSEANKTQSESSSQMLIMGYRLALPSVIASIKHWFIQWHTSLLSDDDAHDVHECQVCLSMAAFALAPFQLTWDALSSEQHTQLTFTLYRQLRLSPVLFLRPLAQAPPRLYQL